MASQYVQDGEFLDYTPGSAVAALAVVVATDRVFVAPRAIAANEPGVLATRGVFKLPKLSTDTPTFGDTIYWDDTNDRCTTTASTHKVIGYAVAAYADGTTEMDVLLVGS
jgi:predicted RecA/RadA family phage recombinase